MAIPQEQMPQIKAVQHLYQKCHALKGEIKGGCFSTTLWIHGIQKTIWKYLLNFMICHTHSHTHHWHATELTKMKYVVEVEVAHNYVLQ